MIETAFTRLLGCSYPIQQAPMGSVSSPALAIAVAEAGGVGTITALGIPAKQLEVLLADMAGRTTGALAANFLTAELDRDALAVAAKLVRLIDFFWVDPDPSLVEIAHREGALVSWQVGSLDEARAAADAGSDLIIVQGNEAGGHVRGDGSLLPLLSTVLDEVDKPVLASGGIGDGRSLAAVLACGASGARIGTRFIATAESGAHPDYKQAVIGAPIGSTEITDAFSVCPLCATSPRARVLTSCVAARNKFAGDLVGETTLAGQKMPLAKGSGMPPGAAATGSIAAMALYASDAVVAVHDIRPAARVVEELTAEAERHLARVNGTGQAGAGGPVA